jgi:galactoside O-acetyltransferase
MSKEYDYSLLKKHGEDVYISDKVEIKVPNLVILGNHVAIDSFFYCTTQLEVGDFTHIGPHISVIGGKSGKLKLSKFNSIGAGTRVICASNEFKGKGLVGYGIPDEYVDAVKCKPVIIEDFVSVGSNCVILPGVTLREGSVIGSGSTVTKSTEPWTVYLGLPARAVKKRESGIMKSYSEKLYSSNRNFR